MNVTQTLMKDQKEIGTGANRLDHTGSDVLCEEDEGEEGEDEGGG